MNPSARSSTIDVIRGVSILLVLLHHFDIAYRLDDTSVSSVFGWNAAHAVARNGNYAVTMFFAVSGFLITTNAQRRWGRVGAIGVAGFYRLRAARVLPCLLLLLAIVDALGLAGVPIFGNRSETGDPVSLLTVDLAALTFWMNVLVARAGWVNYALCVLWSLSVEEVFYLAFPLLCRLLRHERLLAAALAAFAAAGPLWRATHQDDEAEFLYGYLACFDGIAIGCGAALLAARRFPRVPPSLQAAVVAAMAAFYLAAPIGETDVYGVTLVASGTAVLLVSAVRTPSSAGSGVTAAVGACGRLSYELYLFHLVALGLVRTLVPPERTAGDAKLGLLAVYLAASLGVAAVIAGRYSEPLNRRLRGLGDRLASGRAARPVTHV